MTTAQRSVPTYPRTGADRAFYFRIPRMSGTDRHTAHSKKGLTQN